ncbi:MAG: chemotaxis protein CheA, partial [Delftia sp.]|nr:chemotaxis protein CheA [Delftia sp.]
LSTEVDSGAVERELRDITDLGECQVCAYTPSAASLPPGVDEEYFSTIPALASEGEDKTVRISVERLDSLMNLVGELVTDRTRMTQIGHTLRGQHGKGGVVSTLDEATAHFGRVVDQLQAEVMQARMLPISHLFLKFPRLVRDAARATDKQVNLVMRGESTELDRSIIEVIGDPLIHLLRNAVGHGIESPQERQEAGKPPAGTVWLTATHEQGHIVVSVQDDGGGIDPARIRQAAVRRGLISETIAAQLDDDTALALIFQPSLSTVQQVNETSGRGVGLDVVQTNVKRLNGSVTVESELGRGTTFRVTLPLTLAIVQAMLVNLGDDVYAVPLTSIIETTYLSDADAGSVKGSPVIRWRDQVLPLLHLRQVFAHPGLGVLASSAKQAIMTVAWDRLRAGLIVDELIGQQEIVVKS